MRKYLLKNSAFNFLLIIAMGSCSFPLYKGMEPAPLPDNAGSFAWFRADTGRYLFRADISIYGNELSGLLFIKPVDESRRVLFITETGIKIFDMEFTREGKSGVVYVAGYMNRKPVTKTIGKALSPMLFNIGPEAVEAYKDKSSGKTIISSADRNGKKICSIGDLSGKVEELVQDKVISPEVRIRFYSASPVRPDSVLVSGLHNRLNIHLTAINEN
ncbi:MAG: hypothetical protein MUE74_09045 [Bacteroidales bacterium]|jgi:hypothetical protein|nr:hypothetical protein [Bacteroidales bacterium]